jgi:hypothetical protein
VAPGDELALESAADTFTLAEAMLRWQAHRPALVDLEALAAAPGIAENWKQKILSRADWLRNNPEKAAPAVKAFHVKPDQP